MSFLSAVYCLGAGGAPWEPKNGGPWENTYSCSLAPVFADEGTEVNSGEVGPFLSVCSQLEVKAGASVRCLLQHPHPGMHWVSQKQAQESLPASPLMALIVARFIPLL